MTIDIFDEIVGQPSAKKKLNFYLDSYRATRIIPNLMISSQKGNGKTHLARSIAKGLVKFSPEGKIERSDSGKELRKPFVEVNCSTLRNLNQFMDSFIVPYVVDKDVTIFLDEASELPKCISMALLTILNPTPENKTTFSTANRIYDFDFSRQSWIFATSEIQSVFHALTDRLKRLDLEDYTHEQLANIVQKKSPSIKYEDGVLTEISSVLRGNARNAMMMASDISTFAKGKGSFSMVDWLSLKDTLGIAPLGLNATEINILKFLAKNTAGTSLTRLSAKTGLSREALQRDYETTLLKNDLMKIDVSGRTITLEGNRYLKSL